MATHPQQGHHNRDPKALFAELTCSVFIPYPLTSSLFRAPDYRACNIVSNVRKTDHNWPDTDKETGKVSTAYPANAHCQVQHHSERRRNRQSPSGSIRARIKHRVDNNPLQILLGNRRSLHHNNKSNNSQNKVPQ